MITKKKNSEYIKDRLRISTNTRTQRIRYVVKSTFTLRNCTERSIIFFLPNSKIAFCVLATEERYALANIRAPLTVRVGRKAISV